ncbi:protein tyrosine kinase domain-containing protein [Ditylenchus destructor]|uniref:Tyrosine-protein kinase n=1 Tax=Ditylenchus destructor TaxID=166010 RepID=A0AAD4N387_9BILA|nr:protein tyrosine kinase domain-containing protein [Ditylenchus destructor]
MRENRSPARPRSKQPLEEQEYYHGFLPREDLSHLLKENGDFLVRASEPAKVGLRENILSIMCNKEEITDKESGMKHFVLRKTKRTRRYKLDKISFPTIVALVGHHVDKGTPVTEKFPGSILRNPILRQEWELKHDNIKLLKQLGKGAFGEVKSGKLTLKTGRRVDVAIKCAKAGEVTKENIKELMSEARLMRSFEHPNIVKLYGVAFEREPILIVMELVQGGSLDKYLRKQPTTLDEKLQMVLGASWGLEYLHLRKCIHCDIAARNCLYDDRAKVLKISDFGLSREGNFYQLTVQRKMPVKWLAPETLKTGRFTRETDVFSFGILVWEIYSNASEPYGKMTQAEVQEKVKLGYRMPMPSITPHEVADLITSKCWDEVPEKRCSMTEICNELQQIANLELERQEITREDVSKEDVSREEGTIEEVSREEVSREEVSKEENTKESDRKPPKGRKSKVGKVPAISKGSSKRRPKRGTRNKVDISKIARYRTK